jgi:hypothetical protein
MLPLSVHSFRFLGYSALALSPYLTCCLPQNHSRVIKGLAAMHWMLALTRCPAGLTTWGFISEHAITHVQFKPLYNKLRVEELNAEPPVSLLL